MSSALALPSMSLTPSLVNNLSAIMTYFSRCCLCLNTLHTTNQRRYLIMNNDTLRHYMCDVCSVEWQFKWVCDDIIYAAMAVVFGTSSGGNQQWSMVFWVGYVKSVIINAFYRLLCICCIRTDLPVLTNCVTIPLHSCRVVIWWLTVIITVSVLSLNYWVSW